MNLFQLTRELIDIPSTSGDEADVVDYLDERLQLLGFNVERQEVAPRRANLIATLPRSSPRVVLSTHTDTVPPHIPASEDDRFIYGRGACDTKGIIAAQLCAAGQLIAEDVTEFGMLFTVDEEMSSAGARAANLHPLARDCRFIINGEPTDNKLAIACKGSLRVRLHTKGTAAHSAYPEQGDSAITKLLDVLADVRACQFPIDEFLGDSSCNIGVIAGGTRPNVIPAEAHADLQIRLVTDSEIVKQLLESVVARRASIEYLSRLNPCAFTRSKASRNAS
jgi:acetylornithine deacetylase